MATRRKHTDTAAASRSASASGKKSAAPARRASKPAPGDRGAPAAESLCAPLPSDDSSDETGASGLWRAGIKALDTVRQDITRRHTNVIETLLGIAPARFGSSGTQAQPAPSPFPGLEGLGLRKFEDVFDQRVAGALERLGMPTRDEVQALREQLDQVLAQLKQLERGAPKKAPASSGARSKRGPSTGGGTKR